MSKNKTIKFVHDITGKNFADCRRLCKLLSWNEELIIMATIGGGLQKVADANKPVVEGVAEALANVAEAAANVAEGLADLARNAAVFIDDAFKWQENATADILTPADEVAAILDAAEKGAES